ncbi:MAG: arginine repressor [Pseudomonadota bacterium]
MKKRLSKNERRQLILDLLQRDIIASQRDLRAQLQRHGVDVNQATLSRDLRDMGILKVPQHGGGSRYLANPKAERAPVRHEQTLRHSVIRLGRSLNMLVLLTAPGNASVAALALDNLSLPGILGTVAGDDTILVVLDASMDMDGTERSLRTLLALDGADR